jgi:glycosyltransferase involved in cell wall biosynthesis
LLHISGLKTENILLMIVRAKLNVIIPLFNPHSGWENHFSDSILQLREELKEADLTVILVNDGSTFPVNGIDEMKAKFGFLKYYSYPSNMGKGYAIRYGINISDADFYIYTDIDFPFGHLCVSRIYSILKSSGANIVTGTRDKSYFEVLPTGRRIYSVLLKEFNYLITGFKIRDTQAGLKGLDNKAKEVLAQTKINTFLFELEFLKNSLKQGLTYDFIDVTCRPGIKFTNFRFRILLKEIISLLKLLLN